MSGLVVDGDTGHFALATLVSMAGEETLLALMRNEIRLTDEVLVDWLEYVASISAVPGLVEAVDGAELAPALANAAPRAETPRRTAAHPDFSSRTTQARYGAWSPNECQPTKA